MIKNKSVFFTLGQLSLAISILLNHFVKDTSAVSFIIGMLTGLAIVFNLAFLVLYGKEKRKADQ